MITNADNREYSISAEITDSSGDSVISEEYALGADSGDSTDDLVRLETAFDRGETYTVLVSLNGETYGPEDWELEHCGPLYIAIRDGQFELSHEEEWD